jgi:predicted amidohydrolase YtcJ
MQVICLDSEGAYVSNLVTTFKPDFSHKEGSSKHSSWINISDISRLRPAEEPDFLSLPVLHQGFIDSHMHPSWMARLLNQIHLKEKTGDQILDEIKSENKNIYYGFGWDEEFNHLKIDEIPTYFDSLLPQEKEFYLFRKCGHSAYLSKAAKKKLNIKHSGLLKDDEIEKIPRQVIESTDFIKNFKKIFHQLKNLGISSCCDLLVSQYDFENINLVKEQEFDIVCFGDVKDFNFFKNTSREVTPYIKIFLDGSLGARSAWLSQPYEDDLQNKGLQIWPDEILFKKAEQILDQGFLLAFHAIGDAALDQALRLGDALKLKLEKTSGKSKKFFHRLEHLQICREDQIEKIKKQEFWTLGLQPSHRMADSRFILERLGEKRLITDGYRLKSFIQAGLRISLGSDAPIVSPNPLECLHASSNDPRSSENISFSQIFELMIAQGRRNSGFEVKKLTPHSKAFLSYIN